MTIMRTRAIVIHADHPLYGWCDVITRKGTNLKNAVRFRQRQILTAQSKDEADLTENEKEVVDEVRSFMRADVMSGRVKVDYDFMYRLMQESKNPDYFAEGLPRQSAQHVVKQAVKDMDSYFAALRAYSDDPSKFAGKPELPGYARKGGRSAVVVTNQDCTLKTNDKGQTVAGLPLAKKTPLCIGRAAGKLKEVKVVPRGDEFEIHFNFEREIPDVAPREIRRVVAVDFGVDNLMAVVNNAGAPCLLYKGGIPKSINRHYNKRLAEIMSEATSKEGCPLTKDGKPKFVPTSESLALTAERNRRMKDFMLKEACHFVAWCVENRIDAIAFGVNKGWKQEVELGKVNDQSFVQIPFRTLQNMIRYKAEEFGIVVIEQEESYTSKASFLDRDPIPVYGQENGKPSFSGRRRPTRYKGTYKKDGFRGLYASKDGTIVNSDLNGSANILRKALPDAFANGVDPNFSDVVVIKDPDLESVVANRIEQGRKTKPFVSKSKARRLSKKIA